MKSDNQPKNAGQRQKHSMKISQLAYESGINKSTIHHYINFGLLPEPLYAGLNLQLYDQKHLERLLEIKKLRKEEKLSLKQIKKRFDSTYWTSYTSYPVAVHSSQSKNEDTAKDNGENTIKAGQIIETAAKLFSQKGYDAVRINDITEALQMGKSTFYVYFESKEEVFLACIDKLSLWVVPEDAWDDIIEEKDFFKKQAKRLIAFLKAFPSYSGILNLARHNCSSTNKKIAIQAQKAILVLTNALEKDIRRAQKRGCLKDINPDIVSHMMIGMAEGLGYRVAMDPKVSLEEVKQVYVSFLKTALEL